MAVEAARPTADPTTAAQLYADNCARCHGDDGKNPTLERVFPDLPDFTSAKWEQTHTKAELSKSILNGKGAMPGYRGDLDGLTAGQLVDYVRSFARQASSKQSD